MLKRSLVAAAAAGMMLTSVPAMADEPTTREYGDQYLSIVCPAGTAQWRANRAAKRAFVHGRVAHGTPVPGFYRQAARKASRADSRAGLRMNRARWPAGVQDDIDQMVKYYYSVSLYWWSRAAYPVVSHHWRDNIYNPGNADTRVSIALGIPAVGGCRRVT